MQGQSSLTQLFEAFSNQYNNAFQSGVTTVISSEITAISGVLSAVLLVWVAVQGIMVITGQLGIGTGINRIIRTGFVAALVTASGNFTTYVQQFFMTTLPGWIASTITGSTGTNAGAQQFDLLWSATLHLASAVGQQATGISGLPVQLKLFVAVDFVGFTLMVSFVIWEITQAMMGLVVAIGPFVVVGYLFDATRGIAERWIGKLVGLAILDLLVSVLLQILIAGDSKYMIQIQGAAGNGAEEQVLVIFELGLFFSMGAVLMVMLPSIAAYIGGGIAGNSGSIATAMFTTPLRRLKG